MPSKRVHCAISKGRTGFDFEELHKWIDEPYETLGKDHRTKRHAYNKAEAKKIKDFWNDKKGDGWGDKAVIEWLFHITVDNLETTFKFAKRKYGKDKAYNFFKFGLIPGSKFIYFDAKALEKYDIKDEFSNVYSYDDEEEDEDW